MGRDLKNVMMRDGRCGEGKGRYSEAEERGKKSAVSRLSLISWCSSLMGENEVIFTYFLWVSNEQVCPFTLRRL